jgi:hypothetical protein
MCPAARNFSARQGGLTQKHFVYFQSNQRRMAEKTRRPGMLTIFKQALDFVSGQTGKMVV